MLDFDEAQKLVSEYISHTCDTEEINLAELNQRILATDIIATHDVPPADNSAMDGYAIKYTDLTLGKLNIQSHVYAGQIPEPLLPGHAMRIFTGSLLPVGADTIVIQENCTVHANQISVNEAIGLGDFVRYRGEDMTVGACILKAGTRLHAGHIGMLAAQGHTTVTVYKTPRIGILTTGDEIIQPGAELPEASIYDSNTSLLTSLCQSLNIQSITRRHAADDLHDISHVLDDLCTICDVILTVGGVSVGDKDFIKPAIYQLGGKLDLWRVQMKPGKPMALATIRDKVLIGLPGNPVSAFVVFILLASPLIRKIQGETNIFRPVKKARIRLDKAIHNGSRTDFIRVKVNYNQAGRVILEPYHLQSSGAISSLAWADGLARLPVNAVINDGDELDWYEFVDHMH